MNLKDNVNMGFIDNIRKAIDNAADSLTGQENIYHRSTGKTQKEFENDINTYKALERGLIAESILDAAGLGAGLGVGLYGTAGSTIVPGAAGMEVVKSVAPYLPAGEAAILGGLGGTGLGLALTSGEKIIDGRKTKGGKIVAQIDQSAFNREKSEEALAEGQGDEAAPANEGEKKEEVVTNVETPGYDLDEMAGEFILGVWGDGQDRIDNMIQAGYSLDDYNKIQQRVNDAYASGRNLYDLTNKANEKLKYW